jgi:neutral ceramidase
MPTDESDLQKLTEVKAMADRGIGMRRAAIAVFAVLGLGCSEELARQPLPVPVSPPPLGGAPGFRAGFGRADITPPPGLGIGGDSFEGQQTEGYRHRLFVRAMLLEDAQGERIAFVVADLPGVSPILHRRVAEQTARGRSRVGADRLMLSATHSHAAPGHLYEVGQYNDQAGALPGFEPGWVEFLVARLASAVEQAAGDLGPARAGWGTVRVPEVTRNRSMDAYVSNRQIVSTDSVDNTLTMLRVDRCPSGGSRCTPAGAFSVFAIHATGYPPVNALMDGDVYAIVERRLERHIDDLNGREPGFESHAFHVFANGTEGDVSPSFPPASRCWQHLAFRAGRRPAGPRTVRAPEEWRMPADKRAACLDSARRSVNAIGDIIADSAAALFGRLASTLAHDLTIARAFTTLNLRRDTTGLGLCPEPLSGSANFGGAEDGRTRLFGWRILGVIPTGIEEGGHAIDRNAEGCHGAKAVALGPFLQGIIAGEHGFPEYAQLGLVRVGNTMVGFTPWEVTTEAGARIREAVQSSGPSAIEHVALVSLANGYVQYLTTAEEYEVQAYEGGSNLYGPATAAVVGYHLQALAASLEAGSPIVTVDSIVAYPGRTETYLPSETRGPPPDGITRVVTSMTCGNGRLLARWIDAYPGALVPADGQVLEIRGQPPTRGGGARRPPGGSSVVPRRLMRVRASRAGSN